MVILTLHDLESIKAQVWIFLEGENFCIGIIMNYEQHTYSENGLLDRYPFILIIMNIKYCFLSSESSGRKLETQSVSNAIVSFL